MNEFLIKDKSYKIVTSAVENTTIMKLFDFDDNFLYFNASEFVTAFEENDTIELYTELESGIWYAKTNVVTFQNGELKLTLPVHYEFLQRRRSERLIMNCNMKIDNDGRMDDVLLKDLSIGGIKILTDKQILLKKTYNAYLDFDNINVSFDFLPLRLSVEGDKFEVSGTISIKNQFEKIELMQYYQNKKFELENRK